MDRDQVARRREALRPRCEHGVVRASGSHPCAGDMRTCECCRSSFCHVGIVDHKRCRGCRQDEVYELTTLLDTALHAIEHVVVLLTVDDSYGRGVALEYLQDEVRTLRQLHPKKTS